MGAMIAWFKNKQTPDILLIIIGGICLFCFTIGISTSVFESRLNYTIKTIGFDTKPSVESAQNLRANLSALYADIANDLLTNSPIGISDDFKTDLKNLSDAIVISSKNITYDNELYLMKDIQPSLTHLYTLIGELRTTKPEDRVKKLIYTSNIEHLMLYASRLEEANANPLENAYNYFQQQKSYILIFMFVTFIVSLIIIQIWLMKKTNRIFNIPLFIATSIAGLTFVWTTYAIIQEQVTIRVAKEDAYDSLHQLYRAKADLYTMNSDESMWLLDKSHNYDLTFATGAKRVLDIDVKPSNDLSNILNDLDKALAFEKNDQSDQATKTTPKLIGYLGTEMNNITFGVAERKPATDAIKLFVKYLQIDKQIRDMSVSDMKGAIALCIGNNEGQSNWTFDRLIKAIDTIIKVNNDEFQSRIDQAANIASYIKWVSIFSLIIIAFLGSFGLWQRYEEFN